MTEQKINDSVVFNCSVVDYNHFRHTVEWLYEGKGETSSQADPSPPSHRSTVALTTSLHQKSAFFRSIKCKVTNNSTEDVQLFTFIQDSPVQNTGWSWWYIVVSVASTGILIIILVFIKWKKTKEIKTKIEDNSEPNLQPEVTILNPETREDVVDSDGDVYASVCHDKNTKRKKQVYDSVTDSTVNISSPQADKDVVYSTVKKKKPDVTL
ncbi:uncharacterized protein LOC124882403 [Girardinichthys multiradiatus]|uniref:uncharacterized protein LOC124882403 n=1 Tax=Girardinichthys multiradiatus TaxID=208333 RepID=UPI001FAB8295|nr:uncharacterized protein LOC124882403 [Girardinichthys multiradiatus]